MYLKVGSKGDLVRQLQGKLKDLNFDPGPIDGIFGDKTRRAVVGFQKSKDLEADGIAGPITLGALDIKVEPVTPELEREHFRKLLVKNPNYFGNLKVSEFKPVKVIKNNTSYEELMCVGYNPPLEELEAVVHIKKDYGYGSLCRGTPEYVRFYVDWNNDGTWADEGIVSFRAFNIHGNKPLEYSVKLELTAKKKHCTIENMPKVRAILSWNDPPPPDYPSFIPVWGNTLEARIQIDVFKFIPVVELMKMADIELPEHLLATLDLSQPIPTLEPAEMSLGELKELYKDKDVPSHRFAFPKIQKVVNKPALSKIADVGFVDMLSELEIDSTELVDGLIGTDGNTSFEELKCIGYNPDRGCLTGTITVKRPCGYCGNLCKKGSYEYVAFWEWDEIDTLWRYLGTAAVNVHDIAGIPEGGLQYSVSLPVDFSRRRLPCTDPMHPILCQSRIRAILSWEVPPPPGNANWVPTWGNREETNIHIKPGPKWNGMQIPYIESVGNMAVCDIDQDITSSNDVGRATGEGLLAKFDADKSPFGATIRITGFIDNPPKLVMEGLENPLKYKVFVRPYDALSPEPWQPLANSFKVKVTEQTGLIPKQKTVPQNVDSDGYYEYLEDKHGSKWRDYVIPVLAEWLTTRTMGGLWEIKIEAKTKDGTIIPGGALECEDGSTRSVIKVWLDNENPEPKIAITHVKRGGTGPKEKAKECGKFAVGDILYGTYSVTDEHFGVLTLTVHPTGPAHSTPVNPAVRVYDIVPTTGESGDWELDTKDMEPCGYIVRLWTRDRTIVNSGYIGWRDHDDVGFCLEAPEK